MRIAQGRRSGRLCRRGFIAAPSEWLVVDRRIARLGHQVTLFTSSDSTTNASLEVCSPRALRLDPGDRDPPLAYAAMLARLGELASQCDVVYSHLDWPHIPLRRQLIVPFVTTLHGRIDLPDLDSCFERCFAAALFISISDAQRALWPPARWAGTVHPIALLFPICWPEPFGLVMVEAMACGTPVIAFPLRFSARVDRIR
jgi:hypothetical protein